MGYSEFEQSVRKGQLISPWGIGAILPLPKNRSVMIAGLDMWRFGNDPSQYLIDDKRLCRHLGVEELREPPSEKFHGEDTHLTIPAVQFPLWHYCPTCGQMMKYSPWQNEYFCEGTPEKPHKSVRMIPERFVAICPHGHIEDFPILEWVHQGVPSGDGHRITRKSIGSSTTLAAVRYECSCGKSRSMAGATAKGALSSVGVLCSGNRPWLGNNPVSCGEELRVVQAGGSNVWFPNIKSSIWIPPVNRSSIIQRRLDEVEELLASGESADGQLDPNYVKVLVIDRLNQKLPGLSVEEVEREWTLHRERGVSSAEDMTESEDDYRFEEYEVLISGRGDDNSDYSSKRVSIDQYQTEMGRYFAGTTLVRKLRETRAFVGFSRVEPCDNISTRDSLLQLSLESGTKWTPAIKVFGEGIFLQFNSERIREWRLRPRVVERAEILSQAYAKASSRWGRNTTPVSPEFVMIHTFSHLLINRLCYECGYGSSSIRERLYCRQGESNTGLGEMYGVLIYTASGDSEGSMGGLVRMGEPGRLENVLMNALEDAEWCSSDPVCSQSDGQGPDSCNLAACHNCALLPETCCENGNRLLDRLLVVDALGDATGYFEL